MHNMKPHFFKLALVALTLGFACQALALQSQVRRSQGNNLGLQFALSSTVLCEEYGSYHEYPRGSGNKFMFYEGGWGHFLSVARDINGDGIAEDTAYGTGTRGRTIGGGRGSLEAYNLLKQGYDAGERMSQWCSRIEVNEVWSSLDPDNISRWPAEFREGRTAAGAPILHGKETICAMHTDVFNKTYAGGLPPLGADFEYSFYFLDYGESNDIAYGNLFIRNVSEYLQWNENPDFVAQTANTPQGQNWNEFYLCYVTNYYSSGGADDLHGDEGWVLHPEKEIIGMTDQNGIEAGFTAGGYVPVLAYKCLRNCSWNGETMHLSNVSNTRFGNGEFGLTGSPDIATKAPGQMHTWAKGVMLDGSEAEPVADFKGQFSPWTGRLAIGTPGMLKPTDTRFSQWLWGRQARINYASFGPLHNFGPRDTTSTTFAIMFAYPATPPFVLKPSSLEYIDDPDVQSQLVPMEHMGDVVKLVYEGGYILPETPVPPALTIIPGDRQVTITWSNVNLNTPDQYYYFIQQHPEVDPNHYYREYDFEGYKLFRNYTGPQDAHSEMIYQCSLTDNNIKFFYVDTQDKDLSYSRLRNGLKVWYALVPYDRNYDVKTGAEFSLPAEGTSKTWNRPFPEGYHTVRGRSDASNFKMAAIDGTVKFIAADGAESENLLKTTLNGPGDGSLTDPPLDLTPLPFNDLVFIPVNNERLTSAKTIYLVVDDRIAYDAGCAGQRQNVSNMLKLVDGSYTSTVLPLDGGGAENPKLTFQGPVDAAGVDYAFDFTFAGMNVSGSYGGVYLHVNTGSYSGATVQVVDSRWCGPTVSPGTAPSNLYTTKAGRYQVTWKDAGGGNLTVEVKDLTRNVDLSHVDYPDEYGWGFQTAEGYGGDMGSGGSRGTYYDEAFTDHLPKDQRTVKMATTMPADNSAKFGLFVNGILWVFHKDMGDGITMPTTGTTLTIDNAYGYWNGDMTKFTQVPDMAHPGDKWEIKIKPSSMLDSDIDLSKIKVVPNPYIASSLLDESGEARRIDFINLPDKCTIRIYSLGGNLVNVLNHIGSSRTGWGNYTDVDAIQADNTPFVFEGYDNHGGTEPWNLKNRFGQTVASGLYFYHVSDARGKTHTGKFYIIN